MPAWFKLSLIAAHFSVYVVVAINIWIFSRRSHFYTHVIKLRSLPFIHWGFACFAIATSYEVAEHIGDQWIYISQISGLNNLFYSFIVLGLGLISLGLRKNTLLDFLTIACMVSTPILYGVNNGKSLIQVTQLVIAAIFMYQWYRVMKDRRVFLYLLFSNVLALGAGIALINTGKQFYHLFIGPLSAIGLLVLGYVAWIKPLSHLE
ncbi:MAG: hypothetical protein AAGC93_05000 [Cyanobacteria bacterium P01_F01_bin.53]